MWLYGNAGCGKSILSSTIIEDLKSKDTLGCLTYFYFDFNDSGKQTLENLIRSLVSQLYARSKSWSALEGLYDTHDDGCSQPSCDSMTKTLIAMISEIQDMWIVLDALDESTTRPALLTWLQGMVSNPVGSVHLLVTSRNEHDIRSEIDLWAAPEDCVAIQSDLIAPDIQTYTESRIEKDRGLQRWRSRPDIQESIKISILNKADGM